MQDRAVSGMEYLSPVPGAEQVAPQTHLIFRPGGSLAGDAEYGFTVTGSTSGAISGRTVRAEQNRTLLFYPATPFELGETVTVEIGPELSGQNKTI
ncbi:hypothetical protein GF324_01255, partial [bacterium]|nr:hypothetical protein [bacterium]